MDFDFLPRELSAEARGRLVAADASAVRDFEHSKAQKLPGRTYAVDNYDYRAFCNVIPPVVLVFAREVLRLAEQGVWTVDLVDREVREFLRKYSIRLHHQIGVDRRGKKLRPVSTEWEFGLGHAPLLRDFERTVESSKEWGLYRTELLDVSTAIGSRGGVSDVPSMVPNPGRRMPEQPCAAPTNPKAEETGDRARLPLDTPSERRAAVAAFILNCRRKLGFKVLLKHIWVAAGHKKARQFQYWQKADKNATEADDRNFPRILAMDPASFADLLRSKGEI